MYGVHHHLPDLLRGLFYGQRSCQFYIPLAHCGQLILMFKPIIYFAGYLLNYNANQELKRCHLQRVGIPAPGVSKGASQGPFGRSGKGS